MTNDNVKIVSLVAENVKRLKAIRIRPDGSLVVVGGENAQGKTSALDCIEMVMGGKRSVPPRPVREGQEKARAVVELDNGLIVKRTFTAGGGSTVTVEGADGARYTSPQTMLDDMNGELTFDPLAFSRMGAAKQLETLRAMVGLDFTNMDGDRARAFDERRDLKRDLEELVSNRKFVVVTDTEVPGKPVDINEIWAEINALKSYNQDVDRACELVRSAEGDVERLEEELAEANRKLQRTTCVLGETGANPPIGNIEELSQRALDADAINKEIENRHKAIQFDGLISVKERDIETTNQILSDIDERKATQIAAAEFPIDGLSFGDDGVLFNGLPLEQASGAEALRVSVAMGMALNPVLRVMLIRDGSLLSNKSLAQLAETAKDSDYQIWIERVGDGDECSVVIEDGKIK